MLSSGMWKTEGVMEKKLELKFDIVSNPHPHPLIFYRQGKPDGQHIFCWKCNKEFRPPAFACSDDNCNFNIHQSCIDLPNETRSPFHHHVLHKSNANNFPCNCCRQMQYDTSYVCSQRCGFTMDVQCVMADPKASGLLKATRGGELRHFSHPHPLILHPGTDTHQRRVLVSVCLICNSRITLTTSYYSCSKLLPQCLNDTFHQKCAELPRQKLFPDLHPEHPLVLLGSQPFRCVCACCENDCMNFFYACQDCNFYLHVYCLTSFNHKHDFRRLPYKVSFECKICRISNKAIPWACRVCYLLAHKECAIFKMSQGQYHFSSTQDHDSNLNRSGNITKHFSHKQHELTLCRPHDDMLCDGCMRYIPAMSRSYACPPCRVYLHKECATLPIEHTSSLLHPHVLSLFYIPDSMFSCAICLQYCHGFAYRCEECYYVIDIRCATTTFPFKHPSHNHPLTYYDGSEEYACKACGENLMLKKILGCLECKFYLHIRCARLPLAMINRYDEHPLILAFENHEEESGETEYYCDVCEEERNKNKWFYECRICRFAAHIECVVGDYPFLKSANFKNHAHPLTLVNECTKKRHSSISCDECKNSLDGKLAFECGNSNCNFSIHAFGQCYHKQLTEGQISFAMPSLRYRSISLHSDQKWKSPWYSTMKAKLGLEKDKWPTTLSFVSQGNRHGEHWDDGVYSSIRALTIYSYYGSMGIEIDYEHEHGIWKVEHGLCKRYRRTLVEEFTLNHPDEYLTSFHGWYDMNGIRLLSFKTNQRTSGPFGNIEDKDKDKDKYELIKFPTSTELKIVGLHGRSTQWNLTAIGFHFIEI